jgi:hypothetical protein
MNPTTPPKPDHGKTKLRWYQFGLRTLLIVVGLLSLPCVYVVHEARIVQERRRFLSAHHWDVNPPDAERPPIPWVRRLLGDEGVQIVFVPLVTSKAENQRIRGLFPEAEIVDTLTIEHTIPSREFGIHDVITYPDLPPSEAAR